MITTATPEQWAEIATLKQRVIDSVTEQPSDESVRNCVRLMWGRMGVKPEAVLIADCPIVGAMFFCRLRQAMAKLDSQLGSQLDSQLYSQLDSQLGSQLYSQLGSQLGSQLYSQIYVSVGWRAWSGWYEGARILGVDFDPERYSAFQAWTAHVPIIYANAAIPIVSRWPTAVRWKDGRLHHEHGKAVEFRSGWGLWAIDGTPVDEQIVMKPETQTVEQIDSEKNQDVRAIRISRFGWTRYIKDSGAEARDERANDVEGTIEALFRCRDGSQRLVVTCPTGRVFALGVPGDVHTCEQAQRWLGGGEKINIIAAT